jgi:RHS repeat-associated protein
MANAIPRTATPQDSYQSASPSAVSKADDSGGCKKCSDKPCPPPNKGSGSGSGGGGGGGGGFSADPVRYATGEVKIAVQDLSSGGFGAPWGHTRSYSNQLSSQTGGNNGNSWTVGEWPYIVAAGAGAMCVVTGTIYDAAWFDVVGGSYVPRFYMQCGLAHDTANQQFIYTDARGYVTKFFDYSSGIAPAQQGQFKSFTDLGGHEATAGYDATTHLISSFVRGSGGRTLGFYYSYHGSGEHRGQLQDVTMKVNGVNVRRAAYDYYGSGDRNGNLNDLKHATIQQWNGLGWAGVAVNYYRYYKPGEANGFAHGLRYLVGPSGYQKMKAAGITPERAGNGQLIKYADNYFQYDSASQEALAEKAAGGSLSYRFTRTVSGNPNGYNNWTYKTVEVLPDGTQNIVYTNYAAQVILSVYQSGSQQWFNYNQYDGGGRLVLAASSAAVQGFSEASPGLVTLYPHQGLVQVYVYYASTNLAMGAVAGYLQYEQVQQGGGGSPILLKQYQYSGRTAGGATTYQMWKETCYPDATDALLNILCKTYTYTWHGSSMQMAQQITTFPIVPTTQNGSGAATSQKEAYDVYGNLTWQMDERGYLTNQSYDVATGAVIQMIQDVNTSLVSGAPAGWTTPAGGGLNLVTDYTVDGQGRVTQSLGPAHAIDLGGTSTLVRRAAWMVYQDAMHQIWQGSGYATGTSPSYTYTLINPVSLTFMDANQRKTDQIQAVRGSSSTGPLVATDTFPRSSWGRWTHWDYATSDGPGYQRVYFAIPASGAGMRGTHYNQTHYGYDRLQRRIRVQTPGGTIARAVYNPMGWVLQSWTGTNDNGATAADPSGGGAPGNNMVMVESNQYDGNQPGGDGNLTQQSEYQDATTVRVTNYQYDFRDRQIEIDGEIDFCQVTTYDNMDRVTQVDRYDTTTSGNLIGRTVTNYDNLSRAYQTITDAVDPNTGTVGNSLTTNTWYDPSGNVIKVAQAGSNLLQKSMYDGVDRTTTQYQSYNTGETGYPYPVNVASDTVFQQVETTFDAASNVILQTTRDRFHNATGTGSLTGPSGTQPQARVSYMAYWPDPLGRPANTANYGTNGGTALSRPARAPARSSTVLVSTTLYDQEGDAFQVIDPMGTVNQSAFDDAGRLTQLLENYVPGGTDPDQNRETDYTYNADSKMATMTAQNGSTGPQVTQYKYGTTLNNSDLASNDLLRLIIYPDDTTESPDRVVLAYNRQGQPKSQQDQMGSVHMLDYDLLGRLANDRVTTLGTGVDGTVLRISQTYEVRGMMESITSYDNVTVGSGSVVSDLLFEYNNFGQLDAEYQSHSGPVTEVTPAVEYAYADGSSNTIRPTAMTYPSGRVLNYNYGPSGGTNDLLSRIGSLIDNDGITHLADYTYVGLSDIAQVNSSQPGTMLTYIQQAGAPPIGDGGDQYTGWDRFDRLIDIRWTNSATLVDLERTQYGYDQANNRLWRDNPVADALNAQQDEFYTYDGLYQLLTLQRGTLNSGKTGISGTPTWEEDLAFDPTGNWNNYVNKLNGTTTLNQPRTHNPANEILTLSGSSSLIQQNAAGNLNKTPKPSDWSKAFTLTYDAWNRLLKVKSGSANVAIYAYDGGDRRITKTMGTAVRHYYYTQELQIIEERVGTSTTPDRQFVWGLISLDNLLLRDRGTERFYAFGDFYSCTAIADTTGTVQERYGYNAFGQARFMTPAFASRASSSYDWETLYDSYRWDSETGLYHVRYRHLHPTIGRWLTRDPIGYQAGINLYCYCLNRPPNSTDVLGLALFSIVGKSYIAHIDGAIGTAPPGGSQAALNAFAFVTDLGYSEVVTNDTEDQHYRLYSEKTFCVKCGRGGSLTLRYSTKLETDRGWEPTENGPVRAPKLITSFNTQTVSGTALTFSWKVKGRPAKIFELPFTAVKKRKCWYIWHQINGTITCKNGKARVSVSISGSNFPSHIAFVNNSIRSVVTQGPFSGLWNCSSIPGEIL